MTVILESGYSLPSGDEPMTHARIAHSGNWFAGGTVTASTTDSDYFEDAPDNSLTYEKWKPTAIGATWETDLGAAQEVDYCCIAAHDMGTKGVSLVVQYHNGSTWVDVSPVTAIADDSPVMAIFEPVTAQRWRISLSVGTAPKIGVIRFGKALQMQRAIYGGHSPLDLGRQTVLRSNISATGQFLGQSKIRNHLSASFAWQHLTADWVRTNWMPFQRAMEEEPFFIAWRPDDFGEVGYCQSNTPAVPQNTGQADLMSVTLQVKALAYD